ncbi:MAG: hypothetical protein J6S54_06430 [Lentisphaeria bacterium]|nr:hypothetical protein [Lentisphaeria bacterium]
MDSQLFVGTSCVDITPSTLPVITDGMGGCVAKSVESNLEIRAFTFAKGKKAFTLLTCDLLHFYEETIAAARELIRPEAMKQWEEWDFFLAASHTHWGPVLHSCNAKVPANKEYGEFFISKAFEAAKGTFDTMECVSMELGRTQCRMNINRRAIVNGVSFMQPVYPEYTFASVDRPVDHEVVVASFKRADGSYKGILVNWNCHPICFPIAYDAISSCFAGRTMKLLMEKYKCVCGYTNGALGDAAPLLGLKGAESRDMVANDLFAKTAALLDNGTMEKNDCSVFETDFWEMEIKTYPEGMVYCFKEFWGKESAALSLSLFRIGEWAAAIVPGETFAHFSKDFKARSGVKFPQVCSLTNGCFGYMVPRDEFQYGGYEPSVTMCAPGEPERIFDSYVERMKK